MYVTNGINGAGGLERGLSIKARYLAENYGYEVTILSLNDGHIDPFYAYEENDFFSIKAVVSSFNYIILYLKGMKRAISELKLDNISVYDCRLPYKFATSWKTYSICVLCCNIFAVKFLTFC